MTIVRYTVCLILGHSAAASLAEPIRRIPFELESSGHDGLAYMHGGSASSEGSTSTRVNPANLAIKKTYEVGLGFFWSDYSRGFYEAGVADSVSAGFAAGFSFQGLDQSDLEQNRNKTLDSGLTRRLSIGIAKNIRSLSLGFSVNQAGWNEASMGYEGIQYKKLSAYSVSAGANLLLTQSTRIGVSAENFASNDDERFILPKTARLGLHVGDSKSIFAFDLDYKQRSRVFGFESAQGIPYTLSLNTDRFNPPVVSPNDDKYSSTEQLVSAGTEIIVYDKLRIRAAVGQSVGQENERRFYSGGFGVYDDLYQLSYAMGKPYQEYNSVQHSINFGLTVNL